MEKFFRVSRVTQIKKFQSSTLINNHLIAKMKTKHLLVVCFLGLLSCSLGFQQNVNFLKHIEEDPSDIAYSIYDTAKQIMSGQLKALNALGYVISRFSRRFLILITPNLNLKLTLVFLIN